MQDWQPAAYKDYQWIVADPQLLGGKLAVGGTRLAVSLIGSAREFGETANWRALERFAFLGWLAAGFQP